MAQIVLNPGESFVLVGGTNTLSGTTQGDETFVIVSGVNTITADFNTGGDRILLSGSFSRYTFERSGSSIVARGPNGTIVTFPAPNPDLPAERNPVIAFADGTQYALDSTRAGVFTIGSLTITNSPTPIVIVDPAFAALKVAVTDVTEGDTIVATFTLQQAINRTVQVEVSTLPGSATSGADYIAASQTLVFEPGQTVQTVRIKTNFDGVTEQPETVLIRVAPDAFTILTADSDLSATIFDRGFVSEPAMLTTGADRYVGTDQTDRFVGATVAGSTAKLLSSADTIAGGAGNDIIELTNGTSADITIDDADFAAVTGVETLVTNYASITLGANAARAGIAVLDTAIRIDASAAQVNAPTLSSNLYLARYAFTIGSTDFSGALTANLSNAATDTVWLMLAASGGSAINTGTTFQSPAASFTLAPIDKVGLAYQSDPVRITLTAADVGNGSAFTADGRTLAVRLQAINASGTPTGQPTTFDDEGIAFSANRNFVVEDTSGVRIGTFVNVVLGTAASDQLIVFSGSSYLNGGDGADYLSGTSENDLIVGGNGADSIFGDGGADTLTGGAGADLFVYTAVAQSRSTAYDTITDFAYGSDVIDLPGEARVVTRLTVGTLSAATFDADLSAALAGTLGTSGAVLFTASSGDLRGATFLIADGNGQAGYQAAGDYVIRLQDAPAAVPGEFVV